MVDQANGTSLVRSMAVADLPLVLSWRNHPDVRRHMYTQHEIGLEEHRRWFDRVSKDSCHHLLIYEIGKRPLGFVNFKLVVEGGIATWGFYASPDAPKGSGRDLGLLALNYGFEALEIHKVCGQALGGNARSIQMHRYLGFQQEGVMRGQHFDGKRYHDVICFGLLRSEWLLNSKMEER